MVLPGLILMLTQSYHRLIVPTPESRSQKTRSLMSCVHFLRKNANGAAQFIIFPLFSESIGGYRSPTWGNTDAGCAVLYQPLAVELARKTTGTSCTEAHRRGPWPRQRMVGGLAKMFRDPVSLLTLGSSFCVRYCRFLDSRPDSHCRMLLLLLFVIV